MVPLGGWQRGPGHQALLRRGYIKKWDVKYGPGNRVNSVLITEYHGRWVLGSLGIAS